MEIEVNHGPIEAEDPKVLKDFKNVFAGENGQRVLKRILWECKYTDANTRPEDLPLKNFSTWLMQMLGGNQIELAVDQMVSAIHKTPLKGENK